MLIKLLRKLHICMYDPHNYRFFQGACPIAYIDKDICIATGHLYHFINFGISTEARAKTNEQSCKSISFSNLWNTWNTTHPFTCGSPYFLSLYYNYASLLSNSYFITWMQQQWTKDILTMEVFVRYIQNCFVSDKDFRGGMSYYCLLLLCEWMLVSIKFQKQEAFADGCSWINRHIVQASIKKLYANLAYSQTSQTQFN